MSKCYLSMDELIIEYMIYRIRKDYKPEFTITEFMKFLDLLKSKLEIEDNTTNGYELFKEFFKIQDEKNSWDSDIKYIDYTRKDPYGNKRPWPKITMEYSKEKNNYVIKGDYHLLICDDKHLNSKDEPTYTGVKEIMDEFLADEPKRVLDESIEVTDEELRIGKYIAAKMVSVIWDRCVEINVDRHSWPRQCYDMKKYMLDFDLAPVIGVESKKQELLDLYSVLSRRIAILYHQDKNLCIENCGNSVLSIQNYRLLVKDNERLIGYVYRSRDLKLDFTKKEMVEAYEYGTSYWDCDADVKFITTKAGDERISTLVQDIDREIEKNQVKTKKLVK